MERRLVLIPSLIAFVIVLATDALYVALIQALGPPPNAYTPRFVASYLAVVAAIIVLALMPRPEMAVIRVPLRAAAAGGLLVMGLIGAFSIGLPLVVAGVLVAIALTRTARPSGSWWWRLSGLVAAALAIGVLLAGLEVAGRPTHSVHLDQGAHIQVAAWVLLAQNAPDAAELGG